MGSRELENAQEIERVGSGITAGAPRKTAAIPIAANCPSAGVICIHSLMPQPDKETWRKPCLKRMFKN